MRNPSLSSSSNKKTPCCIKVGLKRGPWTPEEDELLSNYINQEGEGRWRTLPNRAGLLRCGKSCRLRWMNYLRPSVKRGHIMPDEEDLILRLHRLLGNRWSLIAGRIPGRTDNEIKNYWNTHLSKKLISEGIDPRTHKPLNPNPNSHAPLAPPNPNPNPSSSISEDTGGYGGANAADDNHGNQYLLGTNLDRNGSIVGADHAINDSWHNYDPLLMGHGNSNEDDDINDCTDDIFSSFLNSLMNEDMLPPQQHQMHNVIGPSDPQVSFNREAASLSPAGMNNKDEHGWLADAVYKHFSQNGIIAETSELDGVVEIFGSCKKNKKW